MATRSMIPLEELVEARDNLETAYRNSLKTIISQYLMQERQVLYEQRASMRMEIDRLNRKIALADKSINATGVNKVNLIDFRYNDSLGG